MKLVDRYIKLKERYPNYIILIKCGNFYNTYFDDAILLSCLCNYKMVNNKIGFPSTSLNKVRSYINSTILVVDNKYISYIS